MSADSEPSINSVEIKSVELELFNVKPIFSLTCSDGEPSLRKAPNDCSRNHTKQERCRFLTLMKHLIH